MIRGILWGTVGHSVTYNLCLASVCADTRATVIRGCSYSRRGSELAVIPHENLLRPPELCFTGRLCELREMQDGRTATFLIWSEQREDMYEPGYVHKGEFKYNIRYGPWTLLQCPTTPRGSRSLAALC